VKASALTALKARRHLAAHSHADGKGRGPAAGRSWLWLAGWPAALALVVLAGAGTYALFHFVILSRVPHAMLGKWVVVGGEMHGAVLEFSRDGTMTAKVNMDGKEGTIKAKVEVDGETMRVTSTNPLTQRPETDTQTIHVLTADEFVIEDRKGTVLRMERLQE